MNHKDLDAWKEAISLAEQVYLDTEDFPKTEQFGLTSQLRRAAVSVAANTCLPAGRLQKVLPEIRINSWCNFYMFRLAPWQNWKL